MSNKITGDNLKLFSSGSCDFAYEFLGCHKEIRNKKEGYVFRVWAPNAHAVFVAGEFTNWGENPIKMENIGYGIWECFSSDAKIYDSYKYLIEKPNGDTVYKRAQAAKELGLTIDTIRNWEMNGLITVKRKQNGYRIYNAADMNRLKIIRSLRCANYSLTAILRMLQRLEEGMERTDIFDILNTPDEEDSIVSECDKLVLSLEEATQNAYEVKQLLLEIKEM